VDIRGKRVVAQQHLMSLVVVSKWRLFVKERQSSANVLRPMPWDKRQVVVFVHQRIPHAKAMDGVTKAVNGRPPIAQDLALHLPRQDVNVHLRIPHAKATNIVTIRHRGRLSVAGNALSMHQKNRRNNRNRPLLANAPRLIHSATVVISGATSLLLQIRIHRRVQVRALHMPRLLRLLLQLTGVVGLKLL